MTIAGLPGIPGGAALVPALDMFIADALLAHKQDRVEGITPREIVGAFIYRHHEPTIGAPGDASTIEWTGEIDWVRLENVAAAPQLAFSINSDELTGHIQKELESLQALCESYASAFKLDAKLLFGSGFSPLVGIGHSHPSGTVEVSAADHRFGGHAATWRRATAPGTLVFGQEEAKFFEADFLLAIDQETEGKGTLVHFKRGSVRGTWEGNFLPKD